MISTYLLFEQIGNRRMNAPEFIYSILYGKSVNMRGRTVDHPEKIIDGVGIDKAIPTKAIKELNKIKEIESRASCQGSSLEKPTFFIFRLKNDSDKDYIKRFCQKLKDDNYHCGFNLGRAGFYRIGVTAKLYYSEDNKKEFENWWLTLPEKIKQNL